MDIPENQLCQAFDPMMVLPEKTYGFVNHYGKAGPSTSCQAPAFVYLEGSRGKRYLCDFHYEYEKKITCTLTPQLWADIEKVVVDNRDLIANTFAPLEDIDYLSFGKCWCNEQGSVRSLLRINKDLPENEKVKLYRYMCNFHFRKTYYRLLSNGRDMVSNEIINDGRKFFNVVPSVEATALKLEQI
jgi:hypothetical protein